ncbi:MAG: hypothetical protein HGB11_13560 [Chlorobiales bacterium]|nr:hypothetical protein [Chlorobiales bacterium]
MPIPPCIGLKRNWEQQKEKLERLIEIRNSMVSSDPSYTRAVAQVSAQEKVVEQAQNDYYDCMNAQPS